MDALRTNRPTLDALRHMPVSDVIALPAEHLALLQTDAREALDGAKRMQDWIEAAIALRYEQRAIGARAAAGKDTGTVRFQDGAVEIAVDLPKRVDWDQPRLATLAEQRRPSSCDSGTISGGLVSVAATATSSSAAVGDGICSAGAGGAA